MVNIERQQTVFDLLKNFNGINPLKELFWTQLNYERVNQPLSSRNWTESLTGLLAEDPLLFAAGGHEGSFHIIYVRLLSDGLLLGQERLIVNRLIKEHPYTLFVFSNDGQDAWHFINVKYDAEEKKRKIFRRITIGPYERLRTASERIALLDLDEMGADLFGIAPLAIQKIHDDAFNVEAVTEKFFEEYKAIFNILQKDLARQTKDSHWAHDYSLQFLNRCMFLYFIQRKGWLGDDREFLGTFWETYWRSNRPDDSFVDEWLQVLFFEAFNNKFHGGYKQFPSQIQEILQTAPYLNGGLFKKNRLDELYEFTITDNRFKEVFNFLERYNFTIAEDSPLDQEIAVDPEMIGKVYESLVNVSEETTERGDAGIFYTPRIEIDLMCRLSLVDYLLNHLGNNYKPILYQFVFAIEEDDKEIIDKNITKVHLWESIYPLISDVTVLDPACGSGSFLVGMLNILDDLQERAQKKLKMNEDVYARKKRIIGQSLYGVDVMEWACHVAELRLWLALIGDAEIEKHDLHVRIEPLLPHFSFKVRCGDSLVQEIGGLNLYHARDTRLIPQAIKARITRLKTEKLKFYNNDPSCKFRTNDEIIHEELNLFRDILETRQKKIQEEIVTLQRKINGPKGELVRLDGSVEKQPRQLGLEAVTMQKQIETLKNEFDQIALSWDALKTVKDTPFVWDIAFVEIFEGDKEGFDIVIGNPPYVRQENIADPHLSREEITTENKKIYKAKLARSVYQSYPKFFGYNRDRDAASRKLDAKSDLYIYFYFHGLSLLNKRGSFCFITSNSWLDVGYGKDLQEFLLKQCHVKMVIDNQVKRSFASADVNTIIALFSAPDDPIDWASDKTAKFIMFKVPFESVLSAVVFDEIEEIREQKNMPEYKVYPIRQELLLIDGCEADEEDERGAWGVGQRVKDGITENIIDVVKDKKSSGILIKSAKYIGNKWGGKYLRAPDIYWTILEKGKGKLVRLGDIAEVRRGFTTGSNEFFYLDEEKIKQWGIEEEFLKPVIKSPRECKRILIDPKDLKYKIFMCHKDKKDLKGTAALEYINWGESQGFHERPSCAGRVRWWDVGERKTPRLNFNYLISSTAKTLFSVDGCYASDNFQEIRSDKEMDLSVCVVLNSTVFQLWVNMAGRSNFGGGLLKIQTYELADLICINPSAISFRDIQLLNASSWDVLAPSTDRHALDAIVFDALGLTQTERDAVYEAVINLVESRLKKAGSV